MWLQDRSQKNVVSGTGQKTTANHVLFRWPMRANANYDEIPNYYTVTNYMDGNRDNNGLPTDWLCGEITYKYHEGNDYSLYPFFWRMKNNGNVYASAGAAGVVVAVRDSTNNDNNCMRNTLENNSANYVAVLNADSSLSRYLHIKTGSALVKEGQFVEEGQLLGCIASSGRSSNPHLHFDLKYFREDNGKYDFIEPFFSSADCNPRTNSSWWKEQKPWIDPQLNRVMTHSATPILQGYINSTRYNSPCPEDEDAKAKNKFNPNESVIVGVALSNVSTKDSLHVRILYPNGVQWLASSRSVNDKCDGSYVNWRNKIYMTFNFVLPSNPPTGTYSIITDFTYHPFESRFPFPPQATPVTKTYKEYFTVGCIDSQTLVGTTLGEAGYIVANDLNSTQTISGKTRYQSANYIKLNPGFTAKAGATFKARIRDCNFSD